MRRSTTMPFKNNALMAIGLLACTALTSAANASEAKDVPDSVIAAQRAALATNTDGKGFGPQSPRDLR